MNWASEKEASLAPEMDLNWVLMKAVGMVLENELDCEKEMR